MAPTIPTSEPTTAVAGTTWKWTRDEATYPPSEGWALSYAFRGLSALDVPATGSTITDDGVSQFTVTVTDEKTAVIAAGTYQWVAYASLDGEKFVADSGVLVVTADASAAIAGALQSHAELMLARVESEIEARLTGNGSAHESYTIGTAAGGRQLSKVPMQELLAMRGVYAGMVWREQNPGRSLPTHAVRFNAPS